MAAHVHLVFTAFPTDGALERRYVGKYWRSSRRVAVLEDHAGFLDSLPDDGALTPGVERSLAILASSSYLRVLPKEDWTTARGETTDPGEHQGGLMSQPTDDEKADATDGLAESMAALQVLVLSGKMSPRAFAQIERGIFGDEQIRRLGNRRSYRDHLKGKSARGVYLDLDFELAYPSDEARKRALKEQLQLAAGDILVRAIDDILGTDHADVWHVFFTHYVARAPTMEAAVLLEARLRADVEAHPLIAGYRLSVTTRFVDVIADSLGAQCDVIATADPRSA